jgi:hypothetical protein
MASLCEQFQSETCWCCMQAINLVPLKLIFFKFFQSRMWLANIFEGIYPIAGNSQ